MKRILALVLMACLLMTTAAAEGPVLLVDLPEETQMIESVEFDDGDFIQTYQLDQGVRVHLLRYRVFDMTLEDLAQGEWMGYETLERLELEEIAGCAARGMKLTHKDTGTVYLILVKVQEQTLIFEAVFPMDMDEQKIQEQMNAWLDTMDVAGFEALEVG